MRPAFVLLIPILVISGCGEAPAPVTVPAPNAAPAGAKAAAPTWFTEFGPAAAEAARTGRPILADVQGSDWCPACQELHAKVFSTQEFEAWAKASVVLYDVDLPNAVAQDPAIRKANEAFALNHQVMEFPGLVLVDAKGDLIAKVALEYPFTVPGVMAAIAKVMPRK